MFTGIEHFAIASPDPKRLADWYVSFLGFNIAYEYEGNYFVKTLNGVFLEIVPATGPRGPQEMRTAGLRHIAISVDDFEAAYKLLREKQVKLVGEPYESQGNRLVFFEDPDGNFLHLIKRQQPLP